MAPLPQQISKNEEKNGHGGKRARAGDCEHHEVRQFPACSARDHDVGLLLAMVRIISRATAFTRIVMQNSTNPSSISAEICMLLVASVNSFAMAAAIEYPGANSD